MLKKWLLNKSLQKQLSQLEKLVSKRTNDLELALSLIKATLEATSDGILVVDLDQKINFYNRKLINILKIPQSILNEGSDSKARNFISTQLQDPSNLYYKAAEAYENPERELLDKLVFKDGRVIEYVSAPRRHKKKITGRVFSFRDITEYTKIESQLIHQATHDTLTNLPNRVVLFDRVEREIVACENTGKLFALLFIDIDNFKLINDTLGHVVGDEVLKIISSRLQQCLRNIDTLARIGSDEFVIIFPLSMKISPVITLAQALLTKVAEPFSIQDTILNITASIGISLYPKDGKHNDQLIKAADTATHAAKKSGRNTFSFFTEELNIKAMRRLVLESDLRLALDNHEFSLVYQPIIEAATQKIISLEALLRWHHPKLGLIPPQEFIPVAEEIGLMLLIGDWVLETACKQSRAWRNLGMNVPSIAINFTATQISQANIVEKVADQLKKNGLDTSAIEMELTEGIIIEDTGRILQIMHELKNNGIKLVIDDFGTGYSSLSYLGSFPVEKIKIDRSLIAYISANPKDVAIVKAIIAMTKSLNLRSLAEGVETKEQWEFLASNHCDEIQGFYFYRPQSAENIEKILQKL